MTYDLPPEPDVEKLMDKDGRVWTRNYTPGMFHWDYSTINRTWRELLFHSGPLEDYKPLYNVMCNASHIVGAFVHGGPVTLKDAQHIINEIFALQASSDVYSFVRNESVKYGHKTSMTTYRLYIEEAKNG